MIPDLPLERNLSKSFLPNTFTKSVHLWQNFVSRSLSCLLSEISVEVPWHQCREKEANQRERNSNTWTNSSRVIFYQFCWNWDKRSINRHLWQLTENQAGAKRDLKSDLFVRAHWAFGGWWIWSEKF